MEFIMDVPNTLSVKSFEHDPRSHMLNHLIFNGITDADVLISSTDKLLGFISESGLFDKTTQEERLLSNWRKNMVDQLMRQGLTDVDLIISTVNKLYDFLILGMTKDQKKTRESFNALQDT